MAGMVHVGRVNGVLTPKGLRINDYVSVIQSVMEGQGIGLGWRHLTERMVRNGSLVQLTNHVHVTGKFFNVAWSRNRDLNQTATGSEIGCALSRTSCRKPEAPFGRTFGAKIPP